MITLQGKQNLKQEYLPEQDTSDKHQIYVSKSH